MHEFAQSCMKFRDVEQQLLFSHTALLLGIQSDSCKHCGVGLSENEQSRRALQTRDVQGGAFSSGAGRGGAGQR